MTFHNFCIIHFLTGDMGVGALGETFLHIPLLLLLFFFNLNGGKSVQSPGDRTDEWVTQNERKFPDYLS